MTNEEYSIIVSIRKEARADTMLSMLPFRNIESGGGNLSSLKTKVIEHFKKHLQSRIDEFCESVDGTISPEGFDLLDTLVQSEISFLEDLYGINSEQEHSQE